MVKLDAYFARIGYDGPRTPTLATLRALHALHPAAIPFENLTPLLGQRVSLELADIEAKLVEAQRGGYCFEHGKLFRSVLDALGFHTTPLAARVVWGPASTALPPRCHMLLLVEAEGERWIADVGFGGVTLTTPLRLEAAVVQPTPHEPFRLQTLDGGDWLLQVQLGENWHDVYRFDLTPQLDADYALSNYYVNTHPESLFVNHLLAARASPGVRHTLFNGELNRYDPQPSQRLITNVDDLRDVLGQIFGIRLPDADASVTRTALDAALARCLAAR